MSSERGSVEPQRADNDFHIEQRQDPGGYLRLILVGELDLSTVPKFTDALKQLKMESERVRLDLSRLEFLDSSGVNALVVGLRRGQLSPHVIAVIAIGAPASRQRVDDHEAQASPDFNSVGKRGCRPT